MLFKGVCFYMYPWCCCFSFSEFGSPPSPSSSSSSSSSFLAAILSITLAPTHKFEMLRGIRVVLTHSRESQGLWRSPFQCFAHVHPAPSSSSSFASLSTGRRRGGRAKRPAIAPVKSRSEDPWTAVTDKESGKIYW